MTTQPIDSRNTICGPWTAVKSPFAKHGTDTEEDWDIDGTWYADDGTTRTVSVGTVYDTSGQMAKLAAAAPALLAALEAIANHAQALVTNGLVTSSTAAALTMRVADARAAIAAARGEEQPDYSGVTDRQFNRTTDNGSLYG
jgi:hypothetical protein